MKFRNLNVLNYANGFTLWHYKCEAGNDPLEPGFFRDASDLLCAGDAMIVSWPEGGNQMLSVFDNGVVLLFGKG